MLGVYKDLSNEAYHSDPESISRSGLMAFKKSPSYYWNTYLNPDRPSREKSTDAAIFGNAFHTIVLEPSQFDNRYAVLPETRLLKDLVEEYGKDQGRILYDKQKQTLQEIKEQGKIVLKSEQLDKLRAMQQSVYKHPQAWDLISNALYEHSIFWDDPHTGIRCKTRPDIWQENMTVDLKTIHSADERSFQYSMMDYGYHIQAAMNREGIFRATEKDIKNHVFICVEKEFPYSVAVYILDLTVIEYAHIEFKKLLTSFAECKQKNEWVGYETKTIFLPSWVNN